MLKYKILITLLFFSLMIPVFAEIPVSLDSQTQTQNVQTTNIDYKQPISKRKIAKKFLFAMSGVAISSILLFVLLSLYNKVREICSSNKEYEITDINLETPDNLRSAIKSFINRTDWK